MFKVVIASELPATSAQLQTRLFFIEVFRTVLKKHVFLTRHRSFCYLLFLRSLFFLMYRPCARCIVFLSFFLMLVNY